jgi:hypothetical protein
LSLGPERVGVSGGGTAARRLALSACASLLAVLGWSSSAVAATYHASDGASLLAAVASANQGSGPNTIELSSGAFLPTSTLTITGNVAIVGPSAGLAAKIEGTAVTPFPSDLLAIEGHARLSLSNVEVTRGGGQGTAAIDDFGELELESSTLAGNRGPALVVQPQASATLRNSTLAEGGAGGVADSGSVSLLNDTVARNSGAGVENRGTVDLTNTILAENAGGDCDGRASSSDDSLDSDGSCGVGALSAINPQLGALAGNGGSTLTMALGTGSPAIGAGDPSKCPPEDQRHFGRPPGRCDLGAFQTNATPSGSTGASGGGGGGGGGGSGSSSPGAGVGKRGTRESVVAHGALRGARRSRISFSVQAVAGESHATFRYSDGSRRVALRTLTLRSLAIDWRRGVATLSGSGVEVSQKRRVSVTLVLVDHGKTRSLSIRLSRGYYKSGRLLDGSIRFTRPS